MGKVFVNMAMSLDGYSSPEGMTLENWSNPGHLNWGAKWGGLMKWLITQAHFLEKLKMGTGGETGPVNDMVIQTFARTGAGIMGKRMFDAGEISWPEDAPFHTDVFVLTHQKRDPWVRPGGTTFYFVTEGPEHALALAKKSAGALDVRISGGADVVQQYLRLGLVDELEIALSPVFFNGGRRLFDNLPEGMAGFRVESAFDGKHATHLRYVRA